MVLARMRSTLVIVVCSCPRRLEALTVGSTMWPSGEVEAACTAGRRGMRQEVLGWQPRPLSIAASAQNTKVPRCGS